MSLKGVVKSFGHLGIIVPDIVKSRKYWTDVLGVPTTEPQELAPGLLISFAEMPNAKMELIQPVDKNCEHYKWLQKHPKGGIHHLCLNTGNLEESVATVAKGGVTTDMKDPLVLSTGQRVIFFNEDTTEGCLTEFFELDEK